MTDHVSRVRAVSGLAALTLCWLTGCVVGPDYVAPEMATPDAWHQAAVQGLTEGQADLQTWWQTFNDPVLNSLIERATEGNLDLELAIQRIEEARLARRVSRSQYWGAIDGTGAVQKTRTSEDLLPDIDLPGIDFDEEEEFFQLGLAGSWEPDLWGRIRRSVESATANYQATIEDYRDLLVILLAEVAGTYVDVRTLQERVSLALKNVDLQEETLKLTQGRLDAGLVPELDVNQAKLNLAQTQSAVPPLQSLLTQAVNRLGVLLGEMPSALHNELGTAAAIPFSDAPVTVGLPADLLRQRPDIRRAERSVAAQNALIGVATSELYPRFLLSGDLSLQATDASRLFNGSNTAYSFGPQFRWSLFSAGRIRNTIRIEENRTDQAINRYEQTVLLAVEEVESAMVAYVQEQIRGGALQRSTEAAQLSVDQVKALYNSGLTHFQNVLDMERSLFREEDALAASRGAVTQNLINIYKALGGGWNSEEIDGEEQPATDNDS